MTGVLILIVIYLVSERIIQSTTGLDAEYHLRQIIIFGLMNSIVPLLLFDINWFFIIFCILIIIRGLCAYKLDKNKLVINIIAVPVVLLFISFVFNNGLNVRVYITTIWMMIQSTSFITDWITQRGDQFLKIMIAIFLIGYEANNILIFGLLRYNFIDNNNKSPKRKKSKKKDHKLSSEDIKRGRAIGILERVLVYVLVIIDKPEAVSIVIAAKAIYRFKSLDDKYFSEYVLFGSFLSLVISLVLSYIFYVKII